MDDKQNPWARWERTRKRGRLRFVLIWGVGVYGGLMAIFLSAMILTSNTPNAVFLVIGLVPIYLLGGAGFGTAIWTISERNYLAAGEQMQTAANLERLE